jgi:hypothetical protein
MIMWSRIALAMAVALVVAVVWIGSCAAAQDSAQAPARPAAASPAAPSKPAAPAGPAAAARAPEPVGASDRLLVREAQLALAQAHIARLQAELQVKEAEARIERIVENLKAQYGCTDCDLDADFRWVRNPATAAPKGAKESEQ